MREYNEKEDLVIVVTAKNEAGSNFAAWAISIFSHWANYRPIVGHIVNFIFSISTWLI